MRAMRPGNRGLSRHRLGGARIGLEPLEHRMLLTASVGLTSLSCDVPLALAAPIGATQSPDGSVSATATVDPGPPLAAVLTYSGDQHDQLRLVDPGDDAV